MVDDEQLVEFQNAFNLTVYETITNLYSSSLSHLEAHDALGLVVSSLSTNLGLILAQIPDNSRQYYVDASAQIINSSLSTAVENISGKYWGQIGHA